MKAQSPRGCCPLLPVRVPSQKVNRTNREMLWNCGTHQTPCETDALQAHSCAGSIPTRCVGRLDESWCATLLYSAAGKIDTFLELRFESFQYFNFVAKARIVDISFS